MTTSRASVWALAAALAAASPAIAMPLDGATLQNRLPGSEIRVNFNGTRGMEDHVWRLQADGSIGAVYTRAPIANDRGALEYGGATGRWWVQGNHLCVQMQGIFAGQGACFAVDAGPGNRAVLTGANTFQPGSALGWAPLNGSSGLPVLRGTITAR